MLFLLFPLIYAHITYKDFIPKIIDDTHETAEYVLYQMNNWIDDNNVSFIKIETLVSPVNSSNVYNIINSAYAYGHATLSDKYSDGSKDGRHTITYNITTYNQVYRLWYLTDNNTYDTKYEPYELFAEPVFSNGFYNIPNILLLMLSFIYLL